MRYVLDVGIIMRYVLDAQRHSKYEYFVYFKYNFFNKVQYRILFKNIWPNDTTTDKLLG